MFKEFSEMRWVNRAGDLLKFGFEIREGPKPQEGPDLNDLGQPIAYVEEPKGDERHIALGKFMDAWSTVEEAISLLLSDATGTPPQNIGILMNALGTRGQIDVISGLASIGMNEDQKKELSDLIDRLKENNKRRNHIVHGRWAIEVWFFNHNEKLGLLVNQVRVYDPSDPDVRAAIQDAKNRKERLKYIFSLKRIAAITAELLRLKNDLREFRNRWQGFPEGTKDLLVNVQLQSQK